MTRCLRCSPPKRGFGPLKLQGGMSQAPCCVLWQNDVSCTIYVIYCIKLWMYKSLIPWTGGTLIVWPLKPISANMNLKLPWWCCMEIKVFLIFWPFCFRTKTTKKKKPGSRKESEEVSARNLPRVTHCGALAQRGRYSWTTRYAVVQDQQLLIYKQEKDTKPFLNVTLTG